MNRVKGNFPVNLSFSWSAALQLPLLDLCKTICSDGELSQPILDAMSKLYLEELDALEKCLATAAAGVGGAHVLM